MRLVYLLLTSTPPVFQLMRLCRRQTGKSQDWPAALDFVEDVPSGIRCASVKRL